MIRIIKADGEEKQFLAEVEKRAGQEIGRAHV